MEPATTSFIESIAGKYLTFRLINEEYGIEITKVIEIIGLQDFTSLPQTPDYIKGVINLRGKIIPVLDLRLKFDFTDSPYTDKSCIIIVEVNQEDSRVMIGLIVDSVSEVMNIQSEEIDDTPNFGVELDTRFIRGMAKSEGSVKVLLDIDNVLVSDRLTNYAPAS